MVVVEVVDKMVVAVVLAEAAAAVQVVEIHQVDPEEMPLKEEWVVLQHLVIMVVLVRLDLITEVEAAAALDKQVVLDQTNPVMDLVDMESKCHQHSEIQQDLWVIQVHMVVDLHQHLVDFGLLVVAVLVDLVTIPLKEQVVLVVEEEDILTTAVIL